MGYRDETETLRARVASLEAELDASKKTIARLGGRETSLPVHEPKRSRALGVPLEWQTEQTLPYEIGDEGYEAVAALLRARLPGGKASQVGRTLVYELPLAEVKVARDASGHTHLSLRGSTPWRAAGVGVLIGLISFLGVMLVSGLMASLKMHPQNIVWAWPLTIALTALVFWKLLRGKAHRNIEAQRQEQLGAFEAVLELAAEHAPKQAPEEGRRIEPESQQPRRIEVEAGEPPAQPARFEAEANEERAEIDAELASEPEQGKLHEGR